MARTFLYDNFVPKGATVHDVADLGVRPADVPQNARPSEVVDGRREWLWIEGGQPKIVRARTTNFGPNRADLGLGKPPKKSKTASTSEVDDILGTKDDEDILGVDEPDDNGEGVDPARESAFSKVIGGTIGAVDTLADMHWNAMFASIPDPQLIKELTGLDVDPGEDVKTLARGVHKEVFRAMTLETALVAMGSVTGGSTTVAGTAMAAQTASRLGKAAQIGRQLLKARATEVVKNARRIGKAGAATGAFSGGFGLLFGPEAAEQTADEFAMDAAAEITGETAARIGLQHTLLKVLPGPMKNSVTAFMNTGHWPTIRKTAGQAAARIAGSAVGAGIVGTATDQSPLAIGITVGLPGIFTVMDASVSAKVLHNMDGIDPTDLTSEGPSAAAFRLSALMDDEVAKISKRVKSLAPNDARLAGELNRLHQAEYGRSIMTASYLDDVDMREVRTRKVRGSDQTKFVSATAEAQGRTLFPNEFNESDITALADAIDGVVVSTTNPSDALKQLQEDFGHFGQINPKKLKPDVVASRVADRWKKLDYLMNQSMNSPDGVKSYVDTILEIETAAKQYADVGRRDAALVMTEKMKDAIVTKGILGAGFVKRVNPNITTGPGSVGKYEYDIGKVVEFMDNKQNIEALEKVFGAKGTRAVKDIVSLMAFQSERPEAASEIGRSFSKWVNYSEARLMFHLITGSLAGPQSKGVEMLKMLGLTAAGRQANDMAISASRFMKMGIANPDKMREFVKAVNAGQTTKQQRLLRSIIRTELNQEEEEDIPIEEEFDLFP